MIANNTQILVVDEGLLILSTLKEACPESDLIPCEVKVQIGSKVLNFSRIETVMVDGVFSAIYKEPQTGWLLKLTDQ